MEPSPEEEPTWGLGDAVKVILVVLAIGATLLGFQVSLDHRLRRRLSHMISPPPPPGPPSPLTLVQALLLNPQDREALQICARRGPQLVPALVREVRLEIGFLDAAARAVLAMGGPGVKALRAYEGPNPESERAAKLILERVEALKAGRE